MKNTDIIEQKKVDEEVIDAKLKKLFALYFRYEAMRNWYPGIHVSQIGNMFRKSYNKKHNDTIKD